ncbi:MAG: hypothetical protein KC585_02585 [Candidatus Magasanikbacteria bacterium]|nr:hypothetical protein [Candidatus Magasanikbacteria bacterium]
MSKEQPIGSLIVVVGKRGTGVSTELCHLSYAMKGREYYTLITTAKPMNNPHIPNANHPSVSAIGLNGESAPLWSFLEESMHDKQVWLVIDSAECFKNQDDAFDTINAIREKGHHVLIGGLDGTLLIEKLVMVAQHIHPNNVRIVRPLCLKHGLFHEVCS